nr:1,6-anhydro-N-acetylmuramyl-L-alanine amidase AmpD [Vogesella oryzae]
MTVPFKVCPLPRDAANLAAALALHDAAHALEVAWLDGYPLPRLWPDAAAIAGDTRTVLAAYDEAGTLCGLLVAARSEDGTVDIVRTLVAPARLGEGWAGRLLTALLAGERAATVMSASGNYAALRCYRKAGFRRECELAAPDGLLLTRLRWQRDDSPLQLTLDDSGWVNEAEWLPSPNCDEYAPPAATPLLVVHNISLPPYQYGGDGVQQLFSNTLDPDEHPYYAGIAGLRVSSHFFIRRDGRLLQFVPTTRRAWHAGVSQWRGRERCNDFALGVELEGCDFEPFTHAQYRTLTALAQLLQHDCGVQAITGHEHIAPGRKTDPGPYFDWARLSAALGRTLPEN